MVPKALSTRDKFEFLGLSAPASFQQRQHLETTVERERRITLKLLPDMAVGADDSVFRTKTGCCEAPVRRGRH